MEKGEIVMAVTLPKSAFMPGEAITVKVEIDNSHSVVPVSALEISCYADKNAPGYTSGFKKGKFKYPGVQARSLRQTLTLTINALENKMTKTKTTLAPYNQLLRVRALTGCMDSAGPDIIFPIMVGAPGPAPVAVVTSGPSYVTGPPMVASRPIVAVGPPIVTTGPPIVTTGPPVYTDKVVVAPGPVIVNGTPQTVIGPRY